MIGKEKVISNNKLGDEVRPITLPKRVRETIRFTDDTSPFRIFDNPERFGGSSGGGGIPPKKPEDPKKPDKEPGGEHKFKVSAEKVKELFEQHKVPSVDVYDLGDVSLDNPLSRISVYTRSNGNSFTTTVDIKADKYMSDEDRKVSSIDTETLKQILKIKAVGSSIYIIDGFGKLEYEVDFDSFYEEFRIKSGQGSTLPTELTTFDEYQKWITRLCMVTETITNAIYSNSNKFSPDIELVLRPALKAYASGSDGSLIDDGRSKLSKNRESLKDKLVIEKPNVNFEDIGGQDKAKREIQGLAFALKNPELYKKWGTKPPKGILLYGPPGTGKTLMAKALATEADAQFLSISISDITSKWYGESEKLMEEVFEIANASEKPTILFFDEVDAIAPDRGEAHEASRRIVTTMLTNIDGIESNPNVMVVCATNRLEAIDPALTRPGRLDRLVEVGLPDSEGRKQIFGIHIKKAEKKAGRELFNGIEIEKVVLNTIEASGADIAEIIRRVLEEKVRQEGITGIEPEIITTEDIIREIAGYERVKQVKRSIGFTSTRDR